MPRAPPPPLSGRIHCLRQQRQKGRRHQQGLLPGTPSSPDGAINTYEPSPLELPLSICSLLSHLCSILLQAAIARYHCVSSRRKPSPTSTVISCRPHVPQVAASNQRHLEPTPQAVVASHHLKHPPQANSASCHSAGRFRKIPPQKCRCVSSW